MRDIRLVAGIVFLLVVLAGFSTVGAQEKVTQVDIIFDASGSMWGQIDGKAKITIAREVIAPIITEFSQRDDLLLGLRVYGHLNKKCDNSVLEVAMGKDNGQKIIDKVMSIKPLGRTPITYSLIEAVNDFQKDLTGEKVIILITDGIESCDGNPCEAAAKLKEAGIVTKVHVVGFGMDEEGVEALKCIAAPSGGVVAGASNSAELKEAVTGVMKQAVSKNLVVTAADDAGKNVFVTVEVYKGDGSSGEMILSKDNSSGEKAEASVPLGVHSIKVKNYDSGDVIWFRSVKFEKDMVIEKKALFAERKLEVKVLGANGEKVLVDVYVFDTAGNQLKYADTSMGAAYFTLLPGIYDIKVDDYRNSKVKWLKGLDLTETKETKKEVKLP